MIRKAGKDAWAVVKRGNMFMLAIGLLLGSAFNAVVSSLANDVIMAAISSVFKVKNVEDLKAGPVLIGKFLAAAISFLIVALVIFFSLWIVFIVINWRKARKLRKNPEVDVEPEPTTEELILQELKKLNEKLDNHKK